MKNLNVMMTYQGVQVTANFINRLNMLSGYSGTGKTFLMQAIELFCVNSSIECVYCNFRFKDYTQEQIEEVCKNAQVVLLDNADLYLTNELNLWLKSTDKFIIMCMKDTSHVDMENVHKYIVTYANTTLTLKEF